MGESAREGEAEVGVEIQIFFAFQFMMTKYFFGNFEQVGKMLSLLVAGQRALARIHFVYFAIIDACNLVDFQMLIHDDRIDWC